MHLVTRLFDPALPGPGEELNQLKRSSNPLMSLDYSEYGMVYMLGICTGRTVKTREISGLLWEIHLLPIRQEVGMCSGLPWAKLSIMPALERTIDSAKTCLMQLRQTSLPTGNPRTNSIQVLDNPRHGIIRHRYGASFYHFPRQR